MYKILLRKLLEAFVTLFCATLIIFALIRLAPGDPVQLMLGHPGEVAMNDTQAYDEKVAELHAQLGLDQNIAVQYASWIRHLLRFDLGASIHTGRQVSSEIAERLPATVLLSISALLIQVMLGLLFGTASALKAGRLYDNFIRMICVALASTPGFVIGLTLLSLFAVGFNAYEISSEASLTRIWLPAITLGLIGAPQLIRIMRANLLAEFGKIYVLSALSRGLNRQRVMRHALRNALLPLITMVGMSFATLIGGAVVIESIFSWPGIGKYALDSILLKDYPVIQGYALVMVSLVVLIHLFVDVAYTLIDPRIHRKGEAGVEEYA
ncbi:MAG: binding-protein-dependent transport system inner rane component [Paenibacillus sp.]|nr:binding-protein-dependent transport system inner rane component [Paenibacillus sp.]